jgi:outer membrane protein OmpA-like peptidoglycan-associated protein
MRTYRYSPRAAARWLRPLLALITILSIGSTAEAQNRRYLMEVGAGAAYQSFHELTDLGSSFGGFGRLGIWLPARFSLEVEAAFLPSTAETLDTSVTVRQLSTTVLYNMPLSESSWAHLRLGLGSTKYFDCPEVATTFICGNPGTLLAGAGLRIGVSPDLLVRGDLMVARSKAKQGTPSAADDETVTNVGVTVGLAYMLGSKPIPDSDADGILENKDRCPETPAGAQVDGNGCPSDSDGDGVPDGVDRCANTPPGASVNATGCTQDSDGDNIPDGLDRCPDTEAGVLVDPNGCPKDSDSDQIPDGLDRCSDTPQGATVDALGCPGDEDGDGVLDGLDRCPRTPAGAAINPSGCPTGAAPSRAAPQRAAPRPTVPSADTAAAVTPTTPAPAAPRQPAARGRLQSGVIQGVAFVTGTARLRPESYVPLDSIATILQADTTLRIEVGAHTDKSGTPSQDQHLTNLQADAVRTYLVTKGVNFQQVQARGYGSATPLTPDNTPQGRLANRRVELRPVITGP